MCNQIYKTIQGGSIGGDAFLRRSPHRSPAPPPATKERYTVQNMVTQECVTSYPDANRTEAKGGDAFLRRSQHCKILHNSIKELQI